MFIGSSNFTYSGHVTNLEANAAIYDAESIVEWGRIFQDRWERSVDYDLLAIYDDDYSPWEIRMRIHNQLFRDDWILIRLISET